MTVLKQSLLRFSHSALFGGVVNLLERIRERKIQILRVVTYHRVDDPENRPHLYPGVISATPSEFRRQVEHLQREYRVLSIWELLECVKEKQPLPPRSVLITFDDAYFDFAEQAWPILRELNLPATLFVPTTFPDEPGRRFWWDRLYHATCRANTATTIETPWGTKQISVGNDPGCNALFKRLKTHLKTLPHSEAMDWIERICAPVESTQGTGPPVTNDVLSWQELQRLSDEGVALAPHTQTHPWLNRVSAEEVRQEAVGSFRDLKKRIGKVPRVLAYPAGGIDRQAADVLKDCGYRIAFTTQRGLNDLSSADPFSLRRINVGRNTNLNLFRAQLLPQMSRLTQRLR